MGGFDAQSGHFGIDVIGGPLFHDIVRWRCVPFRSCILNVWDWIFNTDKVATRCSFFNILHWSNEIFVLWYKRYVHLRFWMWSLENYMAPHALVGIKFLCKLMWERTAMYAMSRTRHGFLYDVLWMRMNALIWLVCHCVFSPHHGGHLFMYFD